MQSWSKDLITFCEGIKAKAAFMHKSLTIRQKGKSQTGWHKKTKHAKFLEKQLFLTSWYAHVQCKPNCESVMQCSCNPAPWVCLQKFDERWKTTTYIPQRRNILTGLNHSWFKVDKISLCVTIVISSIITNCRQKFCIYGFSFTQQKSENKRKNFMIVYGINDV